MKKHLHSHHLFEGSTNENETQELYEKSAIYIEPKTDKEFYCDHCDRKCANVSEMAQHVKTHIMRDKSLYCEECSIQLRSETCFQLHLVTDHGRRKPPFDCPICHKNCSTRAMFRKHYQIHARKIEPIIKGEPMNSDSFTQGKKRSWVWLHFTALSTSSAKCDICSKKLSRVNGTTNGMKKHLHSHRLFEGSTNEMGINIEKQKLSENSAIYIKPKMAKKLFYCDHCDKKYANAIDISKHVQIHNMIDKPLYCKECSIQLPSGACFQLHLVTDHGRRTPPVDCPICYKSCSTRKMFRKHYNIHENKRDFLCGTWVNLFLKVELVEILFSF